jgi:cysteinyl-tRNA synthetase
LGNIFLHQGHSEISLQQLQQQWQTLRELAQVLGFNTQLEEIVKESIDSLTDAEIETLIAQRIAASKAKNWAEGDRLRDQLKAQGITLIDQSGGTIKWHRD